MQKQFIITFDEVILDQLKRQGADALIRSILSRMFNKMELQEQAALWIRNYSYMK
jgi:hypothetical protein